MMMVTGEAFAAAMNGTVLFLGAGFSKAAGCKMSIEMLADLENQVSAEATTLSVAQKEALRFLLSCLEFQSKWRSVPDAGERMGPANIEDLALLIRRIKNREHFVPYPVTGNWADKLEQLEHLYRSEPKDGDGGRHEGERSLFESLEYFLKKCLKSNWLEIADPVQQLQYLDPLRHCLEFHAQQIFRINIFSLNHDLVIEDYFGRFGETPWRGFSNGRWSHVMRDERNDPGGRINLYKLHGSKDWYRRSDDMETWERTDAGVAAGRNEGDLRQDEIEAKEHIDQRHDPYIIFGHGAKYFSVEPYFSLLHHFNNTIMRDNTKYIIAIGYSFFDPYINNLLFGAAKGQRRLIIVNPSLLREDLFVPDDQNNEKRIAYSECDLWRAKYKGKYDNGDLVDHFRVVQNDAFLSELPEFNYNVLRTGNVHYIPMKAEEFLATFFSDGGAKLLKLFDGLDEEIEAAEKPF